MNHQTYRAGIGSLEDALLGNRLAINQRPGESGLTALHRPVHRSPTIDGPTAAGRVIGYIRALILIGFLLGMAWMALLFIGLPASQSVEAEPSYQGPEPNYREAAFIPPSITDLASFRRAHPGVACTSNGGSTTCQIDSPNPADCGGAACYRVDYAFDSYGLSKLTAWFSEDELKNVISGSINTYGPALGVGYENSLAGMTSEVVVWKLPGGVLKTSRSIESPDRQRFFTDPFTLTFEPEGLSRSDMVLLPKAPASNGVQSNTTPHASSIPPAASQAELETSGEFDSGASSPTTDWLNSGEPNPGN